ncbi:hypothetical protein BpHYR1_046990 [Brachionus plicatilis]|uniref:Uncharacterized protein n=1 Tax=Brachionus plicatilis TaxID=10195 RepID=A0A3M7SD98_BRAPC|nr:hypothetical protein BpHYR1_046990 [Brachionus plicatilis]
MKRVLKFERNRLVYWYKLKKFGYFSYQITKLNPKRFLDLLKSLTLRKRFSFDIDCEEKIFLSIYSSDLTFVFLRKITFEMLKKLKICDEIEMTYSGDLITVFYEKLPVWNFTKFYLTYQSKVNFFVRF